jgi:uncharacterized protein YbbC (DUF1343 family)
LAELDALVFDIQDVVAVSTPTSRHWVNVSSLRSTDGKKFIVLDRPNPITGARVEGPMWLRNAVLPLAALAG